MKKTKMRQIRVALLSFVLCFSLMFSLSASAAKSTDKNSKKTSETKTVMTDEQKRALNVLNYMVVLSQEIEASKGSRRYLEAAYSNILNNTNPSLIDEETQWQFDNMLDTIGKYQSISTKRERLNYIYKQNQAFAIRKAIPNPTSLLNVVLSGDILSGLASVIYMAVDAKSNYSGYLKETDEEFLKEAWELDDEEADAIHNSSVNLFDYMGTMCRNKNLDGTKTLSPELAQEFAKIESSDRNPGSKIFYLEKHRATFEEYARYWLVLAETYYDNGEYDKCLETIDQYPELGFFRYDVDYAKTLTKAISAAKECCDNSEYVSRAKNYTDKILKNVRTYDWALRYFVAQVYVDIANIQHDNTYKKMAYELLKENLNNLAPEQRQRNKTYLDNIKKETAGENATRAEKKEIKKYNKLIEKERETELPPVYQPLVVTCDLLFDLAEELRIDDAEKVKIEQYMGMDDGPLFYNLQLQNATSFNSVEEIQKPEIQFDGKCLDISAQLMEPKSTIVMEVTENGKTNTYKKWDLLWVDRGDNQKLEEFFAEYECISKGIKKQKYSEDTVITIKICPPEGSSYDTVSYQMKAVKGKKLLVLNDTVFEMVK